MKKFKFSLDSILKLKRSQEEEALKLMGDAMRRRQDAYETLQAGRRHLGALLTAIRQAREGRIDGWNQAAYLREVARQEALCKHYEETLQKMVAEEEKARGHYIFCRRQAEALEKLKNKRRDLYQKEADRDIERELEEIMLSREGSLLCN
jgi:flagellar FliJ protein